MFYVVWLVFLHNSERAYAAVEDEKKSSRLKMTILAYFQVGLPFLTCFSRNSGKPTVLQIKSLNLHEKWHFTSIRVQVQILRSGPLFKHDSQFSREYLIFFWNLCFFMSRTMRQIFKQQTHTFHKFSQESLEDKKISRRTSF